MAAVEKARALLAMAAAVEMARAGLAQDDLEQVAAVARVLERVMVWAEMVLVPLETVAEVVRAPSWMQTRQSIPPTPRAPAVQVTPSDAPSMPISLRFFL